MHRLAAAALAALLATTLAACGEGEEEDGIDMRPGEDCLACHTGGEPGQFTAAGTVFHASGGGAAGVTVTAVIGGVVRSTTTSTAGNFAFRQPGALSDAGVAGALMSEATATPVTGRCNQCHTGSSRLTVP